MITLTGTKKEIRKKIHELEEKGLLIKKCIYSKEENGFFTMTFKYEVQFGNWIEVGERKNKNEIIKYIKQFTNKTTKELSSFLSRNEMPYWMLVDREAQYLHRLEILSDYCNFNIIY